MKKQNIKILSLVMTLCFLFISSTSAFAENHSIVNTLSDQQLKQRLDKMETEINTLEYTEYASMIIATKKSNLEKIDKDTIIQNYEKIVKDKTQKILSNYGFEPVPSNESDNTIIPMSTSSSLNITDQLSYDSVNKLYRYQGDWNFQDNLWDGMEDIEDIAAVRMTNTSGYSLYTSYAKTWDNFDYQTGYVDAQGQHSPTNSHVTKRFEDIAGVVYNVIDYFESPNGLNYYWTDKGRITQYIKKTSTSAGQNKIFLDYAHNYKYFILNFGAGFSNIGLTGAGNSLSVTYSNVNGSWQRCSGGQTIN